MKIARIFTMFVSFALLLSSCYKRGCMDKDAENYEPGADKECGCCYFYGKGFVRWESNFYFNYLENRVNSLKFYVDGNLVGKTNKTLGVYIPMPAAQYYGIYTPSTYDNTIIFDLQNQKEKIFEVRITDERDYDLFFDSVLIKANKLNPIELK